MRRSVPNVNERRCVAKTTPPVGGCGTIHIGAVSDDHNNFVCITVAEPQVVPEQPDVSIPAEQQANAAQPETNAEGLADEAAIIAVVDPLSGGGLPHPYPHPLDSFAGPPAT